MNMQTGTTVIGRVTESRTNRVFVDYPSNAGVKNLNIERQDIERFESLSDGRVAITVSGATEAQLYGDAAPLIVTAQDIAIVEAMEYGEQIPNGESNMNEEHNDEVPNFGTEERLVMEVGADGQVSVNAAGPFDDFLYAGNRKNKATADWDFQPTEKMGFVLYEDERSGQTSAAKIVDNDGKPIVKHIFNPNYASPQRPLGAHLGMFSPTYYAMPYARGFRPILDMCAKNGWPAKVFAYGEGKNARMDVDVTSSVDWDTAAQNKLGRRWQNLGFVNQGDYRVGFSIYNSLDGSSSFKVAAIAQRLACTNGMVVGKSQTLLKLRHTKGVMENYDFNSLADKLEQVMLSAAEELIEVEAMRNITVSDEAFERLMTLSEKAGLITKPTVHRDDKGEITHLSRGHMWRVMGQGWTNPANSWVRVQGDDQHTLYHVYNILTGAVTHKPIYQDNEHYRNKPLEGKTLGFNAMDKKLTDTHTLLRKVSDQVIATVGGNPDALLDQSESVLEEQLASVPLFSEVIY